MTQILGIPAGPDSPTGTYENEIDSDRAALWYALGARQGVLSGLAVSGVGGLMAVDVSAGAALLAERDGSGNQLARGYLVHTGDEVRVPFGPASAAARNDALVAAFVDVEDGPVGTANLPAGAHLVVIPGLSGTTAPRTDAQITARLGRGGWHRLRDFPIAAGSSEINIGASTNQSVQTQGRNRLGLTVEPGWSLQLAEWVPARPGFVWAQIIATLTPSHTYPFASAGNGGNIADDTIATGWPAAIRPPGGMGFLSAYLGSGISGTARVTTGGSLILTAFAPNTEFTSGDQITIQGEFTLV